MAKRVEDYLKEVDYSFNGYEPSINAIKFINFIKLVENGKPENKTPVVHMKILDNIFSKYRRHAIMAHRGIAKSSLIEYIILYIAVFGSLPNFGEISLALYVSDSAEGGAKNMRKNLEFKYEMSSFLQEYLNIKFTDGRLEFINKKNNKHFIVKLYGGQQNIRGLREQGVRPQIAFLDDLLSDIDANSKTVLSNVENNISKAISKALHPSRHKIIYVGTPFNQNDPLYKRVESGSWNVSVYPICEKFPCSKEEFKGSWEDRFSYEYVKDMYDEAKSLGKLDSFYQELMLQIKSDEDRLLTNDDIKYFTLDQVRRRDWNYYITTDFATSEKESADYSVIGVWGVDPSGKKYLVEAQAKRQLMDKNIEDLFILASKYKVFQVGIEVTGQQKGFVSWFGSEMIKRNTYFNIKEVRPNKNKLSRFMEVLPEFKKGNIIFNSLLSNSFKEELINELENITINGFKSKHDDILDIISMVINLDIILPSSVGNVEEFKDIQDYASIGIVKTDENQLNDLFE